MTPQCRQALQACPVVAGYAGYIELVPPELLAGKEVIATGMRGEVERCEQAIDRAAAGTDTAVVCSGDAGIYAMAGLVLELLESRGMVEAVDFAVLPGVPAVCAAAALLGAPLTHDFACVSLSDLLTPWELIERRLRLAVEADFVLALYNPRSKRRTTQLEQALSIAARRRPPDTPTGFVRNAFRAGQEVRLVDLQDARADMADMLSIVVIGASGSRSVQGRMLTPRGYARKYRLDAPATPISQREK
ncbi:MAG: precorrin-3B C(17)-methyltransferase [Desulfovibrionaceae bacterium]